MRRLISLLAVGMIALSACGADDTPTTTDQPDEPATSLTVSVDPGTGDDAQEWTLTCDPAGGTHPDPEAACAALAAAAPEDLAPVPPDQACTMIYGGPQTATVSGTLEGEEITAEFSREDGCEIARWDAMVDVLQDAGGVTS